MWEIKNAFMKVLLFDCQKFIDGSKDVESLFFCEEVVLLSKCFLSRLINDSE